LIRINTTNFTFVFLYCLTKAATITNFHRRVVKIEQKQKTPAAAVAVLPLNSYEKALDFMIKNTISRLSLPLKQKANLHSTTMARKCVAVQTKTFENQGQRKRDRPKQQRRVTEIFDR